MRAAVFLFLVCGALVSCAAEPVDLARYRVTRPGDVLFERQARDAELAALRPELRAAWCGAQGDGAWTSHEAITRIRTPGDETEDKTDVRAEPFAWTVMTAAAAAFGLDDPAAREALIGNLRRWAKGEALTKLEDRHDNTYYALERTLLPTIVAYALIRSQPELSDDERELIESWLNRLVRLRGIKRPQETRGQVTRLNNHRYLSGSVDMAWGALRGNDDLFRKGVEAFLMALRQMRRDGSLPLETARGARALYYQRHALASLVTMAEMAAVQGHDLYGLEVDGRSLHDAVRYLAAAIRDPELIWAYAQAEVRPGTARDHEAQDLTFLAKRGHGRHYMAWLEPYRARFPNSGAAARLWLQIHDFDPDPRPMIDEYSGGNTTCFFARPPRVRELR